MSTNMTEIAPAFVQQESGMCKCDTCKENCVCDTDCQKNTCTDCSCGKMNQTHVNETILPESTQLLDPSGKLVEIQHGSFVRDNIKE